MQEVTGSIPVFSTKKSTVLRRKYGAFLFVEADFRGLHCFACTVFELFAGGSDTPPPTNVVTKESQRLQRRSYELRNRIQQ